MVAVTAAAGPVVKPVHVTVTEPAATVVVPCRVILMVLAVVSIAEDDTVAGAGEMSQEVVPVTAVNKPVGYVRVMTPEVGMVLDVEKTTLAGLLDPTMTGFETVFVVTDKAVAAVAVTQPTQGVLT